MAFPELTPREAAWINAIVTGRIPAPDALRHCVLCGDYCHGGMDGRIGIFIPRQGTDAERLMAHKAHEAFVKPPANGDRLSYAYALCAKCWEKRDIEAIEAAVLRRPVVSA